MSAHLQSYPYYAIDLQTESAYPVALCMCVQVSSLGDIIQLLQRLYRIQGVGLSKG